MIVTYIEKNLTEEARTYKKQRMYGMDYNNAVKKNKDVARKDSKKEKKEEEQAKRKAQEDIVKNYRF